MSIYERPNFLYELRDYLGRPAEYAIDYSREFISRLDPQGHFMEHVPTGRVCLIVEGESEFVVPFYGALIRHYHAADLPAKSDRGEPA